MDHVSLIFDLLGPKTYRQLMESKVTILSASFDDRLDLLSSIHTADTSVDQVIMRPSSLGGGRILRRTLSVCLSVRPVSGSSFVILQ